MLDGSPMLLELDDRFASRAQTGISVEPVEDLLDPLSRVLVALGAALDLDEAALLQNPDRTDVARRDPGVERPLGDLGDQLREGSRREPAAPELPPDPVADEEPAVLFPAADVPGYGAGVDDRPLHERVVREQPPPVRVERLAVPRRENRHCGRLGVELLFVEDVEVGFGDVAEYRQDLSVRRTSPCRAGVSHALRMGR